MEKWKRWELALALSLCIALFHGAALPGAAGVHWWGVIFPGLTGISAEAAPEEEDAGVRFWIVDFLHTLLP